MKQRVYPKENPYSSKTTTGQEEQGEKQDLSWYRSCWSYVEIQQGANPEILIAKFSDIQKF